MAEVQYYRVIVSKRFYGQLGIVLDICGGESIMSIEEKAYIVRTTKALVDKLKEDNDWVEKIEPYNVHYVSAVVTDE